MSSLKKTNQPATKKTGGGIAVGGGMNFQASVTSFVGVHILLGTPLNWLNGVCEDIPTGVLAESEGPGDDLRIELINGTAIEVQVKKGLQRGKKLWEALIPIAKAIQNGSLSYGVLAVSSDSSNPIKNKLSKDIICIGEDSTDHLSDIGSEWLKQLKDTGISPQYVSSRMRVIIVHALKQDGSDISVAKEYLRSICERKTDANSAWASLHTEALALIERRGRWSVSNLIMLLKSSNIAIREGEFVASQLYRYNEWVIKTNNNFHITGTNCLIPISELLPMNMEVYDNKLLPDAKSALEHYNSGNESPRFGGQFDARWTARFKKQVVIVAGPGLGKTTLLKQLTHQYAQDNYLVLKVALNKVSLSMRNGYTFTESIEKHALDGSSLKQNTLKHLSSIKCVILADGLDECGEFHHEIAEHLNKYSIGNSDTRIIVTTRPIGYETKELLNWSHYRLLPPVKDRGRENLTKLVKTIKKFHIKDKSKGSPYIAIPNEVISISPLLLGMSASLLNINNHLPESKIALYTNFFNLFEKKITPDRKSKTRYRDVILDIVGWKLIEDPLMTYAQLVKRTSKQLSVLTEEPAITLQQDVEAAILQWELAGIVEKVYFEGTALLTFIHKTFCEFAASRYLAEHGSDQLEDLLDKSSMKEVVDFALGHGFAEPLIKFYLARHINGEAYQLTSALDLLTKIDVPISTTSKEKLIGEAFKAIDQSVEDRFSIGKKLSELGSITSKLVDNNAKSRLNSNSAEIKLIAYAIVLQYDSSNYSAITLSNLVKGFLPLLTTRVFSDIPKGRDHSNIDLLQSMALIALSAQPDENALLFAKYIEKSGKIYTLGFHFEINEILQSRKIEKLQDLLNSKCRYSQDNFSIANLLPIGGEFKYRGTEAITLIAKALNDGSSIKCNGDDNNRNLIQFSGFLDGSGFMKTGLNDDIFNIKSNDESSLQSIIQATSYLLPLDLVELKKDAAYILEQIAQGNDDLNLLSFPKVDIDELEWKKNLTLHINPDNIIQKLVHPSSWINYLACCLCYVTEVPLDKITNLLQRASGYPLQLVVMLIESQSPKKLVTILHQHLNAKTTGDISPLLDMLSNRDNTPPPPQIIKKTIECLSSNDTSTIVSASNLLIHYIKLGALIDCAHIKEAIKCRGKQDDDWEIDESLKLLLSKVKNTHLKER
jgi:hypothetical protein